LDLKHIIGTALDVPRDLMAVRPPQLKGPQDQHVECAAKKVDFIGLLRHGRNSTKIEDFLPLQSVKLPPQPPDLRRTRVIWNSYPQDTAARWSASCRFPFSVGRRKRRRVYPSISQN